MLAESFAGHFKRAFQERCADPAVTFDAWRVPRDWTKLMLERDAGVLSKAAMAWALEHVQGKFTPYWEFRKIDLMIAQSFSNDPQSWEFAPALLVEHENAHDVEVEAWNLASRVARLKVLVFYFEDESDLSSKKSTIDRVWRSFAEFDDTSEALLLAAPFTFGSGVAWQKSVRADGEFLEFSKAWP